MSCSSTPTGVPSAVSSWRTVTNASSPLRPDFTATLVTPDWLDSSAPMGMGASWRSRPPANIRRRPGMGGRNGPSAGWPSAPIADRAGCSSR